MISGGLVINSIITRDPNATEVSCGDFESLGGNVIGDFASCDVVLHATDQFGVEPGLGDLIDDGRPGRAHFPLLPTSVAIGAAVQDACSTEDQLGRPRRGLCDSGAVEFRRRLEATLTVSPTTVTGGGSITASWNGIAAPSAGDWIGLYTLGSSNTAFITWIYVSCSMTPGGASAAGSCPLTVPTTVAPGTYQLRLFSNDGFGLLATSNILLVQ